MAWRRTRTGTVSRIASRSDLEHAQAVWSRDHRMTRSREIPFRTKAEARCSAFRECFGLKAGVLPLTHPCLGAGTSLS